MGTALLLPSSFKLVKSLVGGVSFWWLSPVILWQEFIVSQDLWRLHFLQLLWKCRTLTTVNFPSVVSFTQTINTVLFCESPERTELLKRRRSRKAFLFQTLNRCCLLSYSCLPCICIVYPFYMGSLPSGPQVNSQERSNFPKDDFKEIVVHRRQEA